MKYGFIQAHQDRFSFLAFLFATESHFCELVQSALGQQRRFLRRQDSGAGNRDYPVVKVVTPRPASV